MDKMITTGSQVLHCLQHFIPADRIESISEVQLQKYFAGSNVSEVEYIRVSCFIVPRHRDGILFLKQSHCILAGQGRLSVGEAMRGEG